MKVKRTFAALLGAFCIAGASFAQDALQAPPEPGGPVLPSAARCVPAAATYHKVNPWILAAILKVESNFKSKAHNLNANGTVDIGAAQINSMHFKELSKHGIAPTDLYDVCVSTYVAAWHLAKQYRAYGNTWFAVGAYHSASTCFNQRYRGLVWNALVDWKQVSGSKLKLPSLADCGYRAPGTVAKSSRAGTNYASAASSVAFDSP